MPQQIPAEVKADYLRALTGAGFRHIDAVSFVSPAAVPQMADSERVLALLDPGSDVEIIGIVVNQQGAERAICSRSGTHTGVSLFPVGHVSGAQPETDTAPGTPDAGKDMHAGGASRPGRGGLSVDGLRQSLRRPLAAAGRDRCLPYAARDGPQRDFAGRHRGDGQPGADRIAAASCARSGLRN